MTTAKKFQSLRKSRGLSQEELADKIGVSRQAVSKWESEQSTPSIENLILLANIYNISVLLFYIFIINPMYMNRVMFKQEL